MSNIIFLINGLENNDHNFAYSCLKELLEISKINNEVYNFIDDFILMIKDKNSYIRLRGGLLILENAKWDVQGKINTNILDILNLAKDNKPTVVRQFIKSLPIMVKYKLELKKLIIEFLTTLDISKYSNSMKSLIEKDIINTMAEIRKL